MIARPPTSCCSRRARRRTIVSAPPWGARAPPAGATPRGDGALAASDRALAKAYGPRRLRILDTRADIQVGRSDVPAARRTLEDPIRTAEALPAGQPSESSIAGLKKKLDALPLPRGPLGFESRPPDVSPTP